MPVISADDVTKTYGDVTALDGLSLSVESGATFGLLGTNGAGKTTLFKLLVGHIQPDDGRIEVAGRDVETAGTAVRNYVGYLPEHAGFPSSLTGREVLRFHGEMRGLPKADREDRIDEVLETVGLTHAADRAVSGYSNGMQRRLGLATAILARPRILLLDEPTAGLDPLGVAEFHRIIQNLHEQEITVVIASHVLSEVEKLCDTAAVLQDGQLMAAGTMAELKKRVGDEVTVHARLADPDDLDAATDVVRRNGGRVTATNRDTFEATCAHDEVMGLLNALDESVVVDGFEVHEPGLDRAFKQAVGDDASDPEEEAAGDDASEPEEVPS